MLIFYYFFIAFSIIGYGTVINNNIIRYKTNDLGLLGIIGLFFLILFSYISTQFIAHTIIFNSIILITGFILFLYSLKKKFLSKKDLKLFLLICFVFIFFIILHKNHDDFSYYHFPYIITLVDYAHLIGMGNLNLGFNTHSSIFLLSSLFHLPHANYNLFHLPAAYYIIFVNFTLIKILFNQRIINKNLFLSFLTLSTLIFINIFFYRLAEHGTDRSAMILILLLIIKIFYFLNNKVELNQLKIILIILALIISLKAFYVLYFFLLVPVFLFLGHQNIFKNKVINPAFYLSLFLCIMVVLTNFNNSGCLLFPQSITCFEQFSWSQSLDQVKNLNIHYENWSKSGAGAGYENVDKYEYVKNFNWLPNWIDKYFFNKVSDLILSLLLIFILLLLIFANGKKQRSKKINYKSIYLIILVLLVVWFLKFPTLRYGGYHLVFILIFLPLSIYLSKFKSKNLLKKFKFILISVFVIFTYKNIDRIYYEVKTYNFNPAASINYHINNDYFRINNKIQSVLDNKENCDIKNSVCNLDDFKIKKIFKNKYIIFK